VWIKLDRVEPQTHQTMQLQKLLSYSPNTNLQAHPIQRQLSQLCAPTQLLNVFLCDINVIHLQLHQWKLWQVLAHI
jgi:hypothetical protein